VVVNVLLLDFGDTTFADMGVVAFIIFLFLLSLVSPCVEYTREINHTRTQWGNGILGLGIWGYISTCQFIYLYIYIYRQPVVGALGIRLLGYRYWVFGIGIGYRRAMGIYGWA